METSGVSSVLLEVAIPKAPQALPQPVMLSGCGRVITAGIDKVEPIQFKGKASKSNCPQIGVAACRDRFYGEKMFSVVVKNTNCWPFLYLTF